MIKLGDKVKETITGFNGVVTGEAKYLTGCTQYLVQPTIMKDNAYPDAHWFDEGRLKKTPGKKIKKDNVKGETNGCDYTAPIK